MGCPLSRSRKVNICEYVSFYKCTKCNIFWIHLDWSTEVLLREIATKLCFCTNATISYYFRTHQFGAKEAGSEHPSPLLLLQCTNLFFKMDQFCPRLFVLLNPELSRNHFWKTMSGIWDLPNPQKLKENIVNSDWKEAEWVWIIISMIVTQS